MAASRHPLTVIYSLYNSLVSFIEPLSDKKKISRSVGWKEGTSGGSVGVPTGTEEEVTSSHKEGKKDKEKEKEKESRKATANVRSEWDDAFDLLSRSERCKRFTLATSELQRVKLASLTAAQKRLFFTHLHNILHIHAHFMLGSPPINTESRALVTSNCFYIVDGSQYSPAIIDSLVRGKKSNCSHISSPFRYYFPFPFPFFFSFSFLAYELCLFNEKAVLHP